ncbi:anti-sigma factor [Xanthomonas oryzae]|nr:anti-sigma factor [Xanthomonas oryzae]
MTIAPPDEHALHAYVDGRLAPQQHAAVAAWLQAHPAPAARVAGWLEARCRSATCRACRPCTGDGRHALTPAAIRRGLQQRRRAVFAVAASCVLALGLGTGLGWQLHASRVASQRVPMAAAIAAYRLFADAGTQQGVALDVQRRAKLEPWLRTYFGNAGVVPDLHAQGHTLRSGQLLFILEGAAAMLVYSVPIARIGLYLRPRSGPMPTGERRDGRLLAQYWAEGDTAFALIGPATQTRMRTIAPLLRNQG